jgi:hypothetical protein
VPALARSSTYDPRRARATFLPAARLLADNLEVDYRVSHVFLLR